MARMTQIIITANGYGTCSVPKHTRSRSCSYTTYTYIHWHRKCIEQKWQKSILKYLCRLSVIICASEFSVYFYFNMQMMLTLTVRFTEIGWWLERSMFSFSFSLFVCAVCSVCTGAFVAQFIVISILSLLLLLPLRLFLLILSQYGFKFLTSFL